MITLKTFLRPSDQEPLLFTRNCENRIPRNFFLASKNKFKRKVFEGREEKKSKKEKDQVSIIVTISCMLMIFFSTLN